MEHKDFTPCQESLELKELGFDEPCFSAFYLDEKPTVLFSNYQDVKNSIITFGTIKCTRPTFSQAFRFFRDKHNLEYQIIKSANGNYSVVIHLNTQEYLDKISTMPHACLDEVVDCYSYEEAELDCLRKLIQIVKNK
jgi:hypothetical protein